MRSGHSSNWQAATCLTSFICSSLTLFSQKRYFKKEEIKYVFQNVLLMHKSLAGCSADK